MSVATCLSCDMPMNNTTLYGSDADGAKNSSYCICYENRVHSSWCQSCGMPLKKPSHFGTEKDGTKSSQYCSYCYSNGAFTSDMSMEEMIQTCADLDFPMLDENGTPMDRESKVTAMRQGFPTLDRWK